ncbi:MAG TPA: TIGR03000 domain-containing protein [Gemmataceae bacterium]|nr:TIGR03000 domain-containing protein [Gemmataceae bacterium]
MFLKRHHIALTTACAVVALLLAVAPTNAARWGRGGWGGGYSGWGWGGGYNGWGGYNNGWGGYYGGYYPGYSSYWRGYSPDYYSGYYGPSAYYGATPYYTNGYYAPDVVSYTTPSYNTSSFYFSPSSNADFDPNRARIEVRVPAADAQILFDGSATQQQGTDRMFITPSLTPGKEFTYSIQARWMENGKQVDRTQNVKVTPGQTAMVDFER